MCTTGVTGMANLLTNESSYNTFTASGRQCRERRLPERFSEYEMDSILPRPASNDKNKRACKSTSTLPSIPSKNTSPTTHPEIQKPTSDSMVKKKAPSVLRTQSKKVANSRPNTNLAIVPKWNVMKTAQHPVVKTSSSIRKLLQDKRFDFPKLIKEEKGRAFDDDVDLNVPLHCKTVKLVAWIRFHRIYQTGRMHVRYFSHQAGPVILVMRPNEIVAAEKSRDIETMKGDQNAPEIVKKLIDPFISPDESSQYAVLFCDGNKWELMMDRLAYETLQTPTPPPPAKSSAAEPKSQLVLRHSVEPEVREQTEAFTEEQHEEKATHRPAVDTAAKSYDSQQNRKYVEEKLEKIKLKLNILPPKRIFGSTSPTKSQQDSTSTLLLIVPTDAEPALISESSLPPSGASSISSADPLSSTQEAATTFLIPDQSILLRSELGNRNKQLKTVDLNANKRKPPVLVCPQVVKYSRIESAPESLRGIRMSNGQANLGDYSNFGDSSAFFTKQPKSSSKTAPVAPPTPPSTPELEMELGAVQSTSGAHPLPNAVRNNPILPSPSTVASKRGTTTSAKLISCLKPNPMDFSSETSNSTDDSQSNDEDVVEFCVQDEARRKEGNGNVFKRPLSKSAVPHNSTQRQLRLPREVKTNLSKLIISQDISKHFVFFFQKRRKDLDKSLRDLNVLSAPNNNNRPKIVVLKDVNYFISYIFHSFLYVFVYT